jgi:hypothetical protein
MHPTYLGTARIECMAAHLLRLFLQPPHCRRRRLLLTRRARNASGTATQCTRRNDSLLSPPPPPAPATRQPCQICSARSRTTGRTVFHRKSWKNGAGSSSSPSLTMLTAVVSRSSHATQSYTWTRRELSCRVYQQVAVACAVATQATQSTSAGRAHHERSELHVAPVDRDLAPPRLRVAPSSHCPAHAAATAAMGMQ